METWGEQMKAAMGVSNPAFEAGDTEAAIRGLKALIEESGNEPARLIANVRFTTTPQDVREWLSRSAEDVHRKSDQVESYYVEMNGFSINPDRWYAEMMGVVRLTRDRMYAYLDSDPQVFAGEDLTLVGASDAQASYARAEAGLGPAINAAADYLVHATFVDLVRRAWEQGPIDHVTGSLVVTAHDMTPALFLAPHAP